MQPAGTDRERRDERPEDKDGAHERDDHRDEANDQPGEIKGPELAPGSDAGEIGVVVDTLLHWSIDLLSGPTGLASFWRRRLLGTRFTTLSQPLDLGRTTRTVPPHLRKAVILRDKHCQFHGCEQPASVCEVHHVIPWSKGGPTALGNLKLYCRFHHRIVIHRWGWTIKTHPDGTTTATSPDGRELHSHGPPTAVG